MSDSSKQFFEFGPFTFRVADHVLLRDGMPINLPPRTGETLGFLIQNRDHLVSKEELKRALWPGVHIVADNSIDRQVYEIRRALGRRPDGTSYIETKYKRGWRFVGDVTERTEALNSTAPKPLSPASNLAAPPRAKRKWFFRALLVAILATTAAVGLALLPAFTREARVIEYTQLTNDGKGKDGPLLTDGHRIFFTEGVGAWTKLMSIPAAGGEAVALDVPLPNFALQDISPDGSTLLLRSVASDGNKLWAYTISGGALRFVASGTADAGWAPNGKALALGTGSVLSILELPKARKIQASALPGRVLSPKWAPDGSKIRFSVFDARGESISLWEANGTGKAAHRLSAISDGHRLVENGVWTRDGRYYFYQAGAHLRKDLWVLREGRGFPKFVARNPARLTTGSGTWRSPATSTNDSLLFALNESVRSELVRFDRASQSWRPEWDGAPDYELSFSRDTRWVAYTHYPDHAIWKARPDGTERVRLTDGMLEAHEPHWSPDGSRIAVMAKKKNGAWRVFWVSSNGGPLEEIVPGNDDQGTPTWSADGRFLVFGDLLHRKPRPEMSIHLLNLESRRVSDLPGSRGLWNPRWSPDGQYIAGTTSDSAALRILRWGGGSGWKELTRMHFVDHATWSADSRYIYFDGQIEPDHFRCFRISVPLGKLEQLADLGDFVRAPENWFGVALDGTPLASRGVITQEIWALKCVLP